MRKKLWEITKNVQNLKTSSRRSINFGNRSNPDKKMYHLVLLFFAVVVFNKEKEFPVCSNK
jgi:hypothetical protein